MRSPSARSLLVIVAAALAISTPASAQSYRDPAAPVETRVRDLLARMSAEEKFWQLFMLSTRVEGNAERYEHGAFGFQASSLGDTVFSAQRLNAIQHHFVEDTRLGIPVIFFDEAVHGLVLPGATVFPQSIGLAAAFDTALMHHVAGSIASQCRERGVRQVLSPVVNIAADVRWGRVEETYGEDPYLCSQMGAAFVFELVRRGVIATPKHFIANVGDGGRDSYPIQYSERLLREIHLPPFEECIRRGGARSVMTAYNSFDGTPCSANPFLLRTLLTDELGFTGFVISDACAVGGANVLHLTAADYAEAGAQAIAAGLDVIFQTSYDHHSLYIESFLDGTIPGEAIDRAVSRVLGAKFGLGLFERPYIDEPAPRQRDHVGLARRAARESIVLLKNDRATLPLSAEIRSIAVIGSDAAEARLGGYSGPGQSRISILDGIRELLGGAERVVYARGCGRDAAETDSWEAGLEEAAKVAGECDAAVVVTGIEDGEFRDRALLGLPGRQEELIRRVAATGRPTVVVLIGGSAVTMSGWLDDVGAVLEAWYPGEQGGAAVADVIFGEYNPAGRLPITFPVAEGQLPLVYNHKPTGRGDDYGDLTGRPLFPFGFGLSYTTFEYGGLSIVPRLIPRGGSAVVSCTVRNAGKLAGDEVVQLYIHDEIASVARPVSELKGFARIRLEPGESREVTFEITPAVLSMLDADLSPVLEDGDFRIMIGASSIDIRLQGLLTVKE